MGIREGDSLVVRVEEGRLILERREAVLARLVGRWREAAPAGVSLADELIGDRRQEARREATSA